MTPFEAYILIQQNNSSALNTLKQSLKSNILNPNITFRKESLLATAIKCNAPNVLKVLLQHGANPNLKSYENGRVEPALVTAVRVKSLTSVEILLAHGASITKTNFYGSDAIFQAVHENAFDILELLLQEYPPEQSYHPEQLCHASAPHSYDPVVLERGTTSKETASLREKERDSPTNLNDDVGHVLCPFYYALNKAEGYSCKKQSLMLLLQSYYKCKCLEEIASCIPSKSVPGTYLGKDAVRECLVWLRSSTKLYDQSAPVENPAHNRIFHGVINTSREFSKFDNGKCIKLEDKSELNCYKIFKIEGKCHAIKENESSSDTGRGLPSSYVVLVGPLKLSCIAREVIRDQIMFCSRSKRKVEVSSSLLPPLNSISTTVASRGKLEHEIEEAFPSTIIRQKNFRKSLETLRIPSSLKNYILYRKLNGENENNNIQLIKKDLGKNISYFAVYIC